MDTVLTEWAKLTAQIMGQTDIMCLLMRQWKIYNFIYEEFLQKVFARIVRKQSDKFKWWVLFKPTRVDALKLTWSWIRKEFKKYC